MEIGGIHLPINFARAAVFQTSEWAVYPYSAHQACLLIAERSISALVQAKRRQVAALVGYLSLTSQMLLVTSQRLAQSPTDKALIKFNFIPGDVTSHIKSP